jgi:adenylate cyclase
MDLLLESIIDLLTEILNSERATLFLLDKEKNEIWSRIGTRIKNKEIRFPANEGIAGWVTETGISQIIEDAYYHPKFIKEIDNQTGFLTKNILCVPIKNITGEVIGVFEILNKKDGKFTESDEDFLNILAVAVGISIENALLHEKLVQQIKELRQSYENIYISQNVMVKQTKIGTIFEIQEFLKNEYKNSLVSKKLEELKNLVPEDSKIKKSILSVTEALKDSFENTEKFIASMKSKL